MTWDFYETTTQIARKDYRCDASSMIVDSGCAEGDFKPKEWRAIQEAKAEGFNVIKGTKYIKTKGKFDNDFTVFHARIEMDAICVKYDFYR